MLDELVLNTFIVIDELDILMSNVRYIKFTIYRTSYFIFSKKINRTSLFLVSA